MGGLEVGMGAIGDAIKRLCEALRRDVSQERLCQMFRDAGRSISAEGKTSSEAYGRDGACIFLGEYGEALVISPDGRILRGALRGSVADDGTNGGVVQAPPVRRPDGSLSFFLRCRI